jgi:hypothetical protein
MKCQECGKDGSGDVCASCGGTIEESPRWYAEGIAHLTEQKQYAIAFDLLEEGTERYPQSAMLWYNGGVLEELLGNRDGAIIRYQKVLDLRPNNEKARKALERLLGRPLYTPPPATSYAASQADAPAAAAPPTITMPAPMPVPPSQPVAPPMPNAAAPAMTPAPLAEVAMLPVSHHGEEPAAIPTDLPLTLPPAETGGLPWPLIRLINGILALVTFVGMLVAMIIKLSLVMLIALTLFSITLVLFYVAGAMDSRPQSRRRR